ncbi:MAG: carboxypeptidase-like regulatory domain-containing protein [Bacteroidales bacterium]|nr:carboxypeptidase-like regulatory domain-containing protein [Bacteroidales bacterium]MDT8374001.1 carboxypeptidase-like regulatory domain-containing protein [Bacteroidales bacterium]
MRRVFITCPKDRSTRSYCAGRPAWPRIIPVLLLAAFMTRGAAAQDLQPILFHGVVLDADTREPLTGAHFSVKNRSAGAADSRGMFSFYARHSDTVTFTCVGYRSYMMNVADTLRAREYVAAIWLSTDTLMIPAVVVMPRLGNIKAAIMSQPPAADQELINASNNLRIAAYQGITSTSRQVDPASNYELLRQQQRIDVYEKGGIPSSQMVSLSPFTLIPMLYILAKGPPEDPEPPKPYISVRELEKLRTMHDSIIFKGLVR